MSVSRTKAFLVLGLFLILALPTWVLAGRIAQKDSKLLLFSNDLQLVRSLSLGYQPSAYALSEDSSRLYATDRSGNTLLVFDSASGAVQQKIAINGKISSVVEDASRGRVYVLNQTARELVVLDNHTFQTVQSAAFRSVPLFMVQDGQGVIYVATAAPEIITIRSDDLTEAGRISDLEAEAIAIQIDSKSDRLFVQHEKWISAYQLSSLRFIDYLSLEATPLRIQSDAIHGRLYVHVGDDSNSVAVYDAKTLEPLQRIWLKNKTFRNKKVDPSSLQIDSRTGRAVFMDEESSVWFSEEEMSSSGQLDAVANIPQGMTPSPDIPINPNEDKGNQMVPNAKFDGFGNFVVAWNDDDANDGFGQGAFVRAFKANLTPVGPEFSGSKKKVGDQGSPAVGVASNGDFVVVWRDGSGTDGSDFGVFAQMYHAGSSTPLLTTDMDVPDTTSGRQMMPSVDSFPNGKFVVGWSGKKGDKRQTFTKRFDTDGSAMGAEDQSNSESHGNTWAIQVDGNSVGKYVVVWRDDGDNGIRGRAYKADGTTVTASSFRAGPFKQGSTQTFSPSVAIKPNGSFIVVWKENAAGGVVGEMFDANQVSQGKFVVTSKKTGQADAPSIAIAADGSFLVCWRDGGYSSDEIVARWFDSGTNPPTPLSDDFVVPEDPAGDEFESNVAADPAGNFVVVWKDRNRTPTIFGRYFSVGLPPTPIAVNNVTAGSGNRGTTTDYTITGTGFEAGADVSFNDPGITVNDVSNITPVSLKVNVTISNSAFLGFHDVSVIVGSSTGTGTDQFEVKQAGDYPNPNVNSISPNSGTQSGNFTVDINGSNFANHPALSANFGPNITVNSLSFVSGSLLHANITIGAGAAIGTRNVSVSNPGASTGTCTDCFEVLFNPALFTDNFNTGDFNGWTPDGGDWTASTNSLVGTDNGKATIVATGFNGCKNCSIQAVIKVGGEENKTVSLIGWWVDKDNYVELKMDKKSDKWLLKQISGGNKVASEKAIDSAGIVSFQFYQAKIDFDGTTFRVSVHGDPIIEMDAGAPVDIGTVAFRIRGTTGAIDNVLVLP